MSDDRLKPEAKEAIRAYMLKLVAIPGTLGAIGAFFLGFFIRDVAIKQAELDAHERLNRQIYEVTEKAQSVKFAIELQSSALKELESRSAKMTKATNALSERHEARKAISAQYSRMMLDQIKLARSTNADIRAQQAETKKTLDDFSAHQTRHINTMKIMNAYPWALAILARLGEHERFRERTSFVGNRLVFKGDVEFLGQLRVSTPTGTERFRFVPQKGGGSLLLGERKSNQGGIVFDADGVQYFGEVREPRFGPPSVNP